MTQCLDVLEEYLQWRGFDFERLDGATAAADRGAIVDRFNHPGVCPVFWNLAAREMPESINRRNPSSRQKH